MIETPTGYGLPTTHDPTVTPRDLEGSHRHTGNGSSPGQSLSDSGGLSILSTASCSFVPVPFRWAFGLVGAPWSAPMAGFDRQLSSISSLGFSRPRERH
jgi:hypothetical protein